jgi:hypothetical protein
MKVKTTREIVIEIERVRTIRKRCSTHVLFCAECNNDADFITLQEAANLFEVELDLLRSFALEYLCHTQLSDKENFLCLPSLLDRLQKRAGELKSRERLFSPPQLLAE